MAHRAQFHVKICMLFMLLQACSGPERAHNIKMYNSSGLKLHLENGLLLKDGHPFTGIVYTLQPGGRDTAEIISFNQGREDGLWKRYYPGGRLMEKRSFSNGKKVGSYYAWWPDGVMKLAYHFYNGEYNGTCREWNQQGALVKEMNYRNGYEDGRQMEFYDDGRIRANYIIKDGRRYGLLGTKNCVNVSDSVFTN